MMAENKNVLIECDKDEMQKRIASCIAIKRREIDIVKVKEFCHVSSEDETENCARVDAVFRRRMARKGYVKTSNECSPQMMDSLLKPSREMVQSDAKTSIQHGECNVGVEERLRNLETHLLITPKSNDINKRLKEIEDRILFMKSVSPEYFDIEML